MIPAENTSTFGSNFLFSFEEEFIISGATYPGVPHLLNKYSGKSQNEDNPKSTNLSVLFSKSPLFFKIIFSGFKSQCIIPLDYKYANDFNRQDIILITLLIVNYFLEEI